MPSPRKLTLQTLVDWTTVLWKWPVGGGADTLVWPRPVTQSVALVLNLRVADGDELGRVAGPAHAAVVGLVNGRARRLPTEVNIGHREGHGVTELPSQLRTQCQHVKVI